MNMVLTAEAWAIACAGGGVAAAALLIRVGWRRGKRMEDR
jgi:hypothetical protein